MHIEDRCYWSDFQTCGFNVMFACVSVLMTLTLEDYVSKYWPKLQGAIDQLLNMKPGAYIPISYEQMYRSVLLQHSRAWNWKDTRTQSITVIGVSSVYVTAIMCLSVKYLQGVVKINTKVHQQFLSAPKEVMQDRSSVKDVHSKHGLA